MDETACYSKELKNYTGRPVGDFEKFCREIIINNSISNNNIEIIRFPDSISTCVCLINNAHMKKLGYFADNIFKKYGSEDVDTCWSIMKLGFDCAIAHDVYVHHFRGKSLKDNRLDRCGLLKRSNTKLYNKWQKEINGFLAWQSSKGINVADRLAKDNGDEYWLLSQMNKSINLLDKAL